MAQQTASGVRGIPRPVQSFSAKDEAEVLLGARQRTEIGHHGILAEAKVRIGRGI